jgi:cytochrome P450
MKVINEAKENRGKPKETKEFSLLEYLVEDDFFVNHPERIINELVTLVVAGTLTTGSSITNLMYYITKNKEVQLNIRE